MFTVLSETPRICDRAHSVVFTDDLEPAPVATYTSHAAGFFRSEGELQFGCAARSIPLVSDGPSVVVGNTNLMDNTPGRLILIAGLPGSGKSNWMQTNTPAADFFVVDDFMAHAFGDIGRFTYSRWYFPLVFALRAGRDAAISDIAFCDVKRRDEAERVLSDAVENVKLRWVFFERAPKACQHNIERDEREKGRSAAGRLLALKGLV